MLKIEIEQVCRHEWPRWIIKDSSERVFTGKSWSCDRKQALLFADRSQAEVECSRLHDDFSERLFQVNLIIEVQSNALLDQEEIKTYLSRHARIELDQDVGPDCLFANFHAVIDWDTFRT